MDDIYSDLENYNEVNLIDELREENKELKFKLEEYASNIDKLQKDFDKLSSEYKKLETNYSSLLKTAKKEIERKTQIISNLNVEKDMMVLNSLKNSNKNILNIRRNMTRDGTNSFKMNKKDSDSGSRDRNKNFMDLPENKKCDTERNEDNRMASMDRISSVNTDEMNTPNVEKPRKLESYSDKNSEGKENITKMKSRPQSIRNRRKSMPAVSHPCAKLSSDEEFERNYSGGEGRLFKDWPARDDTRRNYNDKLIHKVSETSGIDEKYSSYHESSRETYYKGKPNRFTDKYRSRDKYDLSQRYRRHFSPERQHRRVQRDHSDDRFQRPEYGRQRVLEGSPDRYEFQRKNRDRRSNYERENYHDERQRHHHERYTVKHKNLSDYDEPTCKRARTESYGRPLEEDVRWHTHIEVTEQPALSRMVDNLQDVSCQSPDYILADTLSAQPIREIMYTAATQLEDPRLTSKNYVTTSDDDQVVLSTVTGRNVHLKVIDKSTWKIERVDIPDALQRPPQYTDELVKQMYMDIDNPASNMSMESGEIQSNQSEINYAPLGDVVTESLFNDYERERSKDYDVAEEKINIDVKEKHVQSSSNENPLKPKKYKIPKVKHKDKSSEHSDVHDLPNPLCKLFKEMSGGDIKTEESFKRNKPDSKKARQDRVHPDNITSEQDKILENKNNDQPLKTSTTHRLQTTLSNREIVEGDLELSDETSDYVVKPKLKALTIEKSTRVHKSKTHKDSQKAKIVESIEKDKKSSQVGFDEINTNKVSVQVKVERSISEADDSTPETDKKKKIKRKTQKGQGTNESQSMELKKTTEKKKRSKKEKEPKIKDLKPKFSDLFGDSSTVDLITPSDLGIPETELQSQPSTKYLPIFEDAQDAIDINVDEIRKIETVSKVDNPVVDASQCGHKAEDLKFEIDNANKICPDSTKKSSTKSDDVELVPTGEINKGGNVYENLNIEPLSKEPDVVKTVIISTGIQHQSIYNSDITLNHEQVNNPVDKLAETQNKILSKIQEAPIQALATSTPYKNLLLANVNVDKDIRIPESNCNSSDSRSLRNDVSATIDESSASNGLDSQNDGTDVPDVRIFVRRRRKFVKK